MLLVPIRNKKEEQFCQMMQEQSSAHWATQKGLELSKAISRVSQSFSLFKFAYLEKSQSFF